MARPRVLVSDELSETAVQIFRDRGVDVDYLPKLGKDKANVKYPGVLVGLIAPLGAGDLKLGFTVLRKDAAGVTTTVNSKVGVGYHYKFSKRTKIYVDYGHDSKVKTESSGYDLGVQHNF